MDIITIRRTNQYNHVKNDKIMDSTTGSYYHTNSFTGAQSHSCYSFCPKCGVDITQFSHEDHCPHTNHTS